MSLVRQFSNFTPLAAASLLVLTGSALGQDSADDSIEAMRARLDGIRAENAKLRAEIDELRSATDDRWLTEQRTEEIRQIVHDVIADADTRSSLLDSGLMAGWSEHFFLADPSGRFKLQFEGQIQVRAAYNYHDSNPNVSDRHIWGFETTRTKLTLSGHMFRPELTYMLRTDATRNEPGIIEGLFFLRDAWVRYQMNENWSIRAGQFKLPFNREELVDSDYTQAVERSLVNENLNLGRAQGIEATWADETRRFSFAWSDGAADSIGFEQPTVIGTNTVNTDALQPDTEFAFTSRYETLIAGSWEQFEDMTSPPGDETGVLFGLGAHWQVSERNGRTTFRRDEIRWFAAAADLSLEYGGMNIFASAMYHYVDLPALGQFNIFGAVGQFGYYLTPKWEMFMRYEWAFLETQNPALDAPDLPLLTVGANYYMDGHDFKWTTDFGWAFDAIGSGSGGEISWAKNIANYRQDQRTDDPQVVFRTQIQLLF